MQTGAAQLQSAALSRPPAPRPAPATVRVNAEAPDPLFNAFLLVLAIEYFGLGAQYPIVNMTRIPTLLAYGVGFMAIMRHGLGPALSYPQTKIFITFIVWSVLSVVWAVVASMAPSAARFHLDYLILMLSTLYLVDSPKRIERLSLVMIPVIAVLVLLNFSKLNQVVRLGDFRAPHFMADGNDFAWGLVSLMPLSLYLVYGKRTLLLRAMGIAGALISLVGVMGTQSRGATLSVMAGLFVLWLYSRRKMLGIALVAVGLVTAVALAPESYLQRMQTISEYEEDDSAQGRLRAWRSALQMSMDFPLGVGANNFSAAYGHYYIPPDTHGYMAYRWMSPHSVFFRVLGEYGWIGLILIVTLIGLNARDNRRSYRTLLAAGDRADVPAHWPMVLNVGLAMYTTGALFLGGFTYPHLYLLTGLTLATDRMARRSAAAPAADVPAAPAPEPVVNGRVQRVAPARRLGA